MPVVIVLDEARLVAPDPFELALEPTRHQRCFRPAFEEQRAGKVVKLTLTHDGFPAGTVVINDISKGWPALLASLKSLLETGEPLAIPFEAMNIDMAEVS